MDKMSLPLFLQTIALWVLLFGTVSAKAVNNTKLADIPQDHSGRYVLDLLKELDDKSQSNDRMTAPAAMRTGNMSQAIVIDHGSNPGLTVGKAGIAKAVRLIQEYREDFAILFTLFVNEDSEGTLLQLKSGNFIFGIEYIDNGKVIMINQSKADSEHSNPIRRRHTYPLSDGRWHKLAFIVSRGYIAMFADCHQMFLDKGEALSRPTLSSSAELLLGHSQSAAKMYSGAILEAKLVTHDNGLELSCPYKPRSCSTCAKLQNMKQNMLQIIKENRRLQKKWRKNRHKLLDFKRQTCERNCHDDGKVRIGGEKWTEDNECTECQCNDGMINCQTETCPTLTCKHPVHRENSCCPYCEEKCLYNSRFYEHGENASAGKCVQCACRKGRMFCEKQYVERDCPALNCTKSERLSSSPEQCCPDKCRSTLVCWQGKECRPYHATCATMADKTVCRCLAGFEGDGYNCTDIDECLTSGGPKGHHCEDTATCVNTPGSYRCDCKHGYSRVNNFSSCEDINECLDSDIPAPNSCDVNEDCINTIGGYKCQCKKESHRMENGKCSVSTQLVKELGLICSDYFKQDRFKKECLSGDIENCEMTSRIGSNFCKTTFTCYKFNLRPTDTRLKCLMLCALIKRSSPEFLVRDFWTRNRLILKKKYFSQGGYEEKETDYNSLTNETYEFFYDLEEMSLARIMTIVNNCQNDQTGLFSQQATDHCNNTDSTETPRGSFKNQCPDHCNNTDSTETPRGSFKNQCQSSIIYSTQDKQNVSTVNNTCRFASGEPIQKVCRKLQWMMTSLYQTPSDYEDTVYDFKIHATVQNGTNVTRAWFPARQTTALPIIKNVLADFMANMTALTILIKKSLNQLP